jgi:hypothetical protein
MVYVQSPAPLSDRTRLLVKGWAEWGVGQCQLLKLKGLLTVSAPVRNQAHQSMEGVQGYPRSHRSTPPGKYGGQ